MSNILFFFLKKLKKEQNTLFYIDFLLRKIYHIKMTVREIASITGLSSTTVHTALKYPDKVSSSVLEAINKVVENIEEYPKKIREVYIILPHINSFYTTFLIDAIDLLNKENIKAIPFITNEDIEKEKEFISKINFSTRTGIIFNPVDQDVEYSFLKRKKKKPIILTMNRTLNKCKVDMTLKLANKEASEMAVRALADENNKNILLINSGNNNIITAKERSDGFNEAIKNDSNISGDIIYTNFNDWKSSYEILNQNKDKIKNYDAIISTSELITCAILKIFKNMNINIPQDIRLITFDTSPSFEALSISNISFSPNSMAKKAIELLLTKSAENNYTTEYVFLPKLRLLGSEKRNL